MEHTMTPCRFPGCVAASPCPVHDTNAVALGKPCPRCHGTGNAIHKPGGIHIITDLCEQCGGTGLRDTKRSTIIPKHERVPVDDRALIKKIESSEQ